MILNKKIFLLMLSAAFFVGKTYPGAGCSSAKVATPTAMRRDTPKKRIDTAIQNEAFNAVCFLLQIYLPDAILTGRVPSEKDIQRSIPEYPEAIIKSCSKTIPAGLKIVSSNAAKNGRLKESDQLEAAIQTLIKAYAFAYYSHQSLNALELSNHREIETLKTQKDRLKAAALALHDLSVALN